MSCPAWCKEPDCDLCRKFIPKVVLTPGCWIWTAWHSRDGYGLFSTKGGESSTPAHRAVYEHLVGPVPEGLELDHLCRVRDCVRPDHVEPVTKTTNRRRQPRMGLCGRGHDLDEVGFYLGSNGKRTCKPCHKEREAGYRARRKVAA